MEQNVGRYENRQAEQAANIQKRPLPRLPPKPALLHAHISSSTHESVNPAYLPSRGIERSGTSQTVQEDVPAPDGIEGSPSTEPEKQHETQPAVPEHLQPLPTRNGASPALPDKEQRYTSIDDAINSSTTMNHLAQLSLDAPPQPKLSVPETSTTNHHHDPVIHASSPRKNPLLMSSPYRSKPIMPARSSPSGNELCAGCGKTVYFAEGVRTHTTSSIRDLTN